MIARNDTEEIRCFSTSRCATVNDVFGALRATHSQSNVRYDLDLLLIIHKPFVGVKLDQVDTDVLVWVRKASPLLSTS